MSLPRDDSSVWERQFVPPVKDADSKVEFWEAVSTTAALDDRLTTEDLHPGDGTSL